MKPERIIEKLYETKTGEDLKESISELLAEAEHEIREQTAKKGGRSQQLKAAEQVVKRGRKHLNESIHGVWMGGNCGGKQFFTDSHVVFSLNDNHFLPLPIDGGQSVRPDITGLILNTKVKNTQELELPAVERLTGDIKIKKAEQRGKKIKEAGVYSFGPGRPSVNAEYLRETLIILEASDLMAWCDPANPRKPIYFHSEVGEAALMPLMFYEQEDKQ